MDVLPESRSSDAGRSVSAFRPSGFVTQSLHLTYDSYLNAPDVDALFPTEAGCLHRKTRHPHPGQSLPGVRLPCCAICMKIS